MKLEPLYDQILVLDISAEQELDGVILPETSRADVYFSKVMAVGEGYIREDGSVRPLRLAVGDTIVRGMYSGIPMRLDGIEFFLLKEGEALAKLREEKSDD
jgi:chaperonin GroES